MTGEIMRVIIGVFVFLGGLLLLGLWANKDHARNIQDQISAAAMAELGDTRHDVTLDVSGRDITITGIADSEEDAASMIARLDATPGRRVVRADLEIIPHASPYRFKAVSDAGMTDYSGNVPSEAARVALATVLGQASDTLTLSSGAPDEAWVGVVIDSVTALQHLDAGQLEVEDQAVRLSGIAASEEIRAQIDAVGAKLPAGYSWQTDLVVPLPFIQPYSFSALKDGAGLRGSGHAPDEAAAASLRALLSGEQSDTIVLADGAPEAGWVEAAQTGANVLSLLETGGFSLSDQTLTLRGEAASAAVEDEVAAVLDTLPEGYVIDNRIAFPPPILPSALTYHYDVAKGLEISGHAPASLEGSFPLPIEITPTGLLLAFDSTDDALPPATQAFADMAPWMSSIEAAHLVVTPEMADLTITAAPHVDSDRLRADLEGMFAGYAQPLSLTIEAAGAAAEGAERYNALTKQDEISRSGHWLPRLSFVADAQSCEMRAMTLFETGRINFVTGSAELDLRSLGVVNHAAALAHSCTASGLQLEIAGHTDSTGDPEANLRLSQARAEAVKSALEARGVESAAMSARGYGATQPIADNGTEEGRALNRRTGFVWSDPAALVPEAEAEPESEPEPEAETQPQSQEPQGTDANQNSADVSN